MKKIQHIIPGAAATLAACSLISALLLCGCSKDLQEQQAVSSLSEGDVELTIEVTGDAATRTTITHDNKILPVVWKTGDSLHVVGADAGYLGSVKLTEGAGTKAATFKGTVKGWSKAQVLHIYYLGTTDPGLAANAGEFTFSISSQGGTLDWIEDHGHIAHGATAEAVPVGTKTIQAVTLSNLNAVVLFDLNQWAAGTTIKGTYSSAVLDLKTGAFSTKTDGNINIAADKCTANTYVTFIPDSRALTFKQGSYSTSALANTTGAGYFYSNNGTAIDVPRLESGASLPGEFTVDAYGTKVCFSKGNLYCNTSKTPVEFNFEAKQYDCRHYSGYTNSAFINGTIVTTPENTVGTFYYSKTASVSYAEAYNDTGAAAGDVIFTNSTEYTPKSDFAVSGETGWRSLSHNEWTYMLSTRKVAGNKTSYGAATVENVQGLIILPDDWDESLCSTLCGSTSYTSNIFSSSSSPKWSELEEAGCVFLPAVGFRNNIGGVGNFNVEGGYESSVASDAANTYYLWFKDGGSTVAPAINTSRVSADAIRLVREVETEIPEGALSGKFAVSATKRVRFSKGNLQATCSKAGTETTSEYSWGFAENQYDVIGNAEGNTTIASQTVGKKVDLFCWVGKSSTVLTGAATRYGITNSIAYSDYGTEKTTETLMDDWGNIATLPGNSENKKIWRTLTGGSDGEWKYLLETRSASTVNGQANARYAIVKVNGKVGLLLFPDVFTWPYDITKPTYINKVNESTDPNPDYTVDQFVVLQYAGCVFLPAGGRRQSSGVNHLTDGFYYSSNSRTTNISYRIAFGFNDFYSVQDSPFIDGCSVRLVTDVE